LQQEQQHHNQEQQHHHDQERQQQQQQGENACLVHKLRGKRLEAKELGDKRGSKRDPTTMV
jgi:hypothetical protein